MVGIVCALLAVGYTLVYVAGSNLAHGPGHGVGFLEAVGIGGHAGAATNNAPASSGSRPTAPGNPKPPKPGQTAPGARRLSPPGGG